MPVADQPMLALHDLRPSYVALSEFQPSLPAFLEQGGLLSDCVEINRLTGLLEALTRLRQQEIDLLEALNGFATWLSERMGDERLLCSEYLEDAETNFSEIPHQDLCALTFPNASFDLVPCNELFEHVQDLGLAFEEIARVLKPGGRLLATCPLAFGQVDEIVKGRRKPEAGSLVDWIPR